MRPDAATVAQFPAIAADVWSQRQGDTGVELKQLTARLEERKRLKSELLRAKLRGEVNQADYTRANAYFDDDIASITEQLQALRSPRGTLDAFIRFSNLMLVDVADAWQRANVEQRLRVQNSLFQGGIAYDENQKFLNTAKPTLFQQLRGLMHPERTVGVPVEFHFMGAPSQWKTRGERNTYAHFVNTTAPEIVTISSNIFAFW